MSAFLKTKTIKSGEGSRVIGYVLSQGQNEVVELMEDDVGALEIEDLIALQDGDRFGLIHSIYTSDRDLTRDQLKHMQFAMRAEYGIPEQAPSMLVRHEKTGRDSTVRSHYHEIIQGRDLRGRVIDTFRSKKRDELVSRMCEVEFGMELVPGKHNDFVYKAAVERHLEAKYTDAFQTIAHIKAEAKYSSFESKMTERQGFDLHHWTSGLENITRMATPDQPKAFADLVSEFVGAKFRQGDRGQSRLLVTFQGGDIVKNANKILKIEPQEVASFISQAKEHSNELRKNHEGSRDAVKSSRGGADATRTPTRAEIAQQNDPGDCGPGNPGRRGAPHPEHSGGASSWNGGGPRDHVALGAATKSNSSILRSVRDKIEARQIGRIARDLQPMMDEFRNNSSMYHTSTDMAPMPDLADPYLLMKISEMNARQMPRNL